MDRQKDKVKTVYANTMFFRHIIIIIGMQQLLLKYYLSSTNYGTDLTEQMLRLIRIFIVQNTTNTGPQVIELFSCSSLLSMKFQLLIKTKMLKNKDLFCFQTPFNGV